MCQLVSENVLHWKRIISRKISFGYRSGSYPDNVRVEHFLRIIVKSGCVAAVYTYVCIWYKRLVIQVFACVHGKVLFPSFAGEFPSVECRSNKCLCMSSRRIWQHTQYNERGTQSENGLDFPLFTRNFPSLRVYAPWHILCMATGWMDGYIFIELSQYVWIHPYSCVIRVVVVHVYCILLATAIRCYRFFFSFSPLFNSTSVFRAENQRRTLFVSSVPFCGPVFTKENSDSIQISIKFDVKTHEITIYWYIQSESGRVSVRIVILH